MKYLAQFTIFYPLTLMVMSLAQGEFLNAPLFAVGAFALSFVGFIPSIISLDKKSPSRYVVTFLNVLSLIIPFYGLLMLSIYQTKGTLMMITSTFGFTFSVFVPIAAWFVLTAFSLILPDRSFIYLKDESLLRRRYFEKK